MRHGRRRRRDNRRNRNRVSGWKNQTLAAAVRLTGFIDPWHPAWAATGGVNGPLAALHLAALEADRIGYIGDDPDWWHQSVQSLTSTSASPAMIEPFPSMTPSLVSSAFVSFRDEGHWAAWVTSGTQRPMIVINHPFDGLPATAGNGQMTALMASSRAAVDRCYALALQNGGSSEGKPGLRPEYHSDYYGAYQRWSHLHDQQHGRTGVARYRCRKDILVFRGLKSGRRTGGGDLHACHHRQAERAGPVRLARRRAPPHCRLPPARLDQLLSWRWKALPNHSAQAA